MYQTRFNFYKCENIEKEEEQSARDCMFVYLHQWGRDCGCLINWERWEKKYQRSIWELA